MSVPKLKSKRRDRHMSDHIKTDSKLELHRTPLEDLAAELAVDVVALEERLEMITVDAVACCIINGGGCHVSPK